MPCTRSTIHNLTKTPVIVLALFHHDTHAATKLSTKYTRHTIITMMFPFLHKLCQVFLFAVYKHTKEARAYLTQLRFDLPTQGT